jgi:hypothetical protein
VIAGVARPGKDAAAKAAAEATSTRHESLVADLNVVPPA